jgi:hypothetical protein
MQIYQMRPETPATDAGCIAVISNPIEAASEEGGR